MKKYIGEQSVVFNNPPAIISAASVVGTKEGEGPLRAFFDEIGDDSYFGMDTWEMAESEIARRAVSHAIAKAMLHPADIRYIFAGDLLNQSSGSTFGVRSFGRPYFGLYGACSAIGEGMVLAAMLVDGGYAEYALAAASSHYCGAEKTFRAPVELGTQRVPTASWTVTGAGAVVLGAQRGDVRITGITTGAIVDAGITDPTHMGAAMAPAAATVLTAHFQDMQLSPDYYDEIVTGDLGIYGSELLLKLMDDAGFPLHNHRDCGVLIYDAKIQDTHAGGSGCGCAAVTFAGYLMERLRRREIKRLLFVPTGALHSLTTVHQGESIPGIAHAVAIEGGTL